MTILKKYWPLIAILFGIFILRVPSFFEPHWYGDEGIYLAIGQAMQKGAVLYRDIWDNKPPLLYLIYAISPTLLWAKVSATIFVLGTVKISYFFARKLGIFPVVSALAIGLFLSLPIFEGTIANAELYFTLPIIIGAYFLYEMLLSPSASKNILHKFIVGLCFAIAFFLKVPAVFDFLGMFLAFSAVNFFAHYNKNPKSLLKFVFYQIKFYVPIAFPLIAVFILVVVYFSANHALGNFITASFSQNASYVAVDTGPLSKLSNPLFVHAGMLLVVLFGLVILFLKNRITKEFVFLSFWTGFSIYGALLSNRPYPHYLLQVVPPVVLLTAYLFTNIRKNAWAIILIIVISLGLGNLFGKQLYFVQGLFSNGQIPYYSNFFDYISERKTFDQYANYFDPRTVRNYDIGNYIKVNSSPSDPIFVWGDNAFVYVLSERMPTTKFIQAHHLTTIPPVNYDLIMQRLIKYQPKFIVVSRPVNFKFPKLEDFLKKNYRWIQTFQDLYVYRNIAPITPVPFNLHYN